MIEIELGSRTAILLAIENFILYSRFVMKEPIDKEELIQNIEEIFRNTERQKYWIEKSLGNSKDTEKGD